MLMLIKEGSDFEMSKQNPSALEKVALENEYNVVRHKLANACYKYNCKGKRKMLLDLKYLQEVD